MHRKTSLVFILLCLCSPLLGNDTKGLSDFWRKTYVDRQIGYTLRYFDSDWKLERSSSSYTIYLTSKFYPKINVNIWSNPEDKNLPNEKVENEFETMLKEKYESYQMRTSDLLKVNQIDFLRLGAVAESTTTREKITKHVYSGEKGYLSITMWSPTDLSKEAEEKIESLLIGFSFDGTACKGNPKLRGFKTLLDDVVDTFSN